MTPEIDAAFDAVRRVHGKNSLERVEEMLYGDGQTRHPLQREAKWILPGISQRPWHDPYEHPDIEPIVRAFEAAHSSIKEELSIAWQQNRQEFADYEHYLMRQQNWQALYLFKSGELVPESGRLVPTAMRVLTEEAVNTGRHCELLEAHFSTLLPNATIKPHCDLWNFSINLHLAIEVPEGCAIRVAEETREWEEGKCLLFDYSFEHEAWNRGTSPRTCLLVDLWHPETTVAERQGLTALVTAVRSLGS